MTRNVSKKGDNMTYIEALAEKIGVKEATKAALDNCPGDYYKGGAECGSIKCLGNFCRACWYTEMPEEKNERV